MTATPWQPPTRGNLAAGRPPELARAIADAKLETGLAWRELARITGVPHSHLVLIGQGRRVPSAVVVELLAEALPVDPGVLDALRDIAVIGHGRSRGLRWSPPPTSYRFECRDLIFAQGALAVPLPLRIHPRTEPGSVVLGAAWKRDLYRP